MFPIVCIGQTFYGFIIEKSENPPIGWLVVLRINVDLAIFQPYLDLEAGDNQSLKIQVARPGIEPRSSCSASQELNHSATAAPENPPINSIDILEKSLSKKSFISHCLY